MDGGDRWEGRYRGEDLERSMSQRALPPKIPFKIPRATAIYI